MGHGTEKRKEHRDSIAQREDATQISSDQQPASIERKEPGGSRDEKEGGVAGEIEGRWGAVIVQSASKLREALSRTSRLDRSYVLCRLLNILGKMGMDIPHIVEQKRKSDSGTRTTASSILQKHPIVFNIVRDNRDNPRQTFCTKETILETICQRSGIIRQPPCALSLGPCELGARIVIKGASWNGARANSNVVASESRSGTWTILDGSKLDQYLSAFD